MTTLALDKTFRDIAVRRMASSRPVRHSREAEARFLDEAIPLRGASHADVRLYSVEIPMRYAECIAILNDGRKVSLLDKRQFKGWTDQGSRSAMLFDNDEQRFELLFDVSRPQPRVVPRPAPVKQGHDTADPRRFTHIDGNVFYMPAA